MPRKRRSAPGEHIYSVFVNWRHGDTGTWDTERVYFGNSEFTARLKFAQAVMERMDAHSVDIRRDLRLWLRVTIERPTP